MLTKFDEGHLQGKLQQIPPEQCQELFVQREREEGKRRTVDGMSAHSQHGNECFYIHAAAPTFYPCSPAKYSRRCGGDFTMIANALLVIALFSALSVFTPLQSNPLLTPALLTDLFLFYTLTTSS